MHVYKNEDLCKPSSFNVLLCVKLTLSLQNTSEQRELKDPAKDPQYSEPQIDAMRAQKDQVTPLDQSHSHIVLLYSCTVLKSISKPIMHL